MIMITQDEVMSLLLEACPSFADRWQEHRSVWGDEHLLYLDLGEFAHHLVELSRSDLTDEFPAVFAVIERLHVEGDAFVKEAATIGLPEGMQNIAGHSGVESELFVAYLGPVSAQWWVELI